MSRYLQFNASLRHGLLGTVEAAFRVVNGQRNPFCFAL